MSGYPNTLAQYRDYATDDGEDYWGVDPIMAITALANEFASWPRVRVVNTTTGEILDSGLGHLVGVVAEAIRHGQEVRIEPVTD